MISTEPKKILLVHLYANGDCLYATTVARQIKTDFPNSHLTWAIAENCKSIIDNNPAIDDVLVVKNIVRDDLGRFKKLKRKLLQDKRAGIWDEVFVTHNLDNQALYDGTIRGMVLNAYPHPITVPVQPVLQLFESEIERVDEFARQHKLASFKNVILWEFAPQSGQAVLDIQDVLELSHKITAMPDTCVILTSGNKIAGNEKIIDASVLSIRENAALTHYCTLLIGCSSGITWLSTSSASKRLPMIQVFNDDVTFLNAPSVDFERYGLSFDVLELTSMNKDVIYQSVQSVLTEGFAKAKSKFGQKIKVNFRTTGTIVYNLLCYVQLNEVRKHYKIMTSTYGNNKEFLNEFFKAVLLFPFRLVLNLLQKAR